MAKKEIDWVAKKINSINVPKVRSVGCDVVKRKTTPGGIGKSFDNGAQQLLAEKYIHSYGANPNTK